MQATHITHWTLQFVWNRKYGLEYYFSQRASLSKIARWKTTGLNTETKEIRNRGMWNMEFPHVEFIYFFIFKFSTDSAINNVHSTHGNSLKWRNNYANIFLIMIFHQHEAGFRWCKLCMPSFFPENRQKVLMTSCRNAPSDHMVGHFLSFSLCCSK